jgi:hypothetical protein
LREAPARRLARRFELSPVEPAWDTANAAASIGCAPARRESSPSCAHGRPIGVNPTVGSLVVDTSSREQQRSTWNIVISFADVDIRVPCARLGMAASGAVRPGCFGEIRSPLAKR